MPTGFTLLNVSLIPENAGYEFAFILSIEYTKRKVDDLCLVDEKDERVFVNVRVLDLIPLQGHTLARIDLHEDLLTTYLVRVPLK